MRDEAVWNAYKRWKAGVRSAFRAELERLMAAKGTTDRRTIVA